ESDSLVRHISDEVCRREPAASAGKLDGTFLSRLAFAIRTLAFNNLNHHSREAAPLRVRYANHSYLITKVKVNQWPLLFSFLSAVRHQASKMPNDNALRVKNCHSRRFHQSGKSDRMSGTLLLPKVFYYCRFSAYCDLPMAICIPAAFCSVSS